MEKGDTAPHSPSAADVTEGLRQAMEGQQFTSLKEAQAFTDLFTQQRNQRSIDEFHGLSPEQMHRMLHFPFFQ